MVEKGEISEQAAQERLAEYRKEDGSKTLSGKAIFLARLFPIQLPDRLWPLAAEQA